MDNDIKVIDDEAIRNETEAPTEPVNRGALGIPAPAHEVDYGYFLWLCEKVGLDGGYHLKGITEEYSDCTFFTLAGKLYSTEFKALVKGDDNRAADGKKLRYWFSMLGSAFSNYDAINKPNCSVLEMLVALVQRMERSILSCNDNQMNMKDMFWIIMNNIGILKSDSDKNIDLERSIFIQNAIEKANNRAYGDDGKGSFFTPKKPPKNFKNLELWYQMQNFVLENDF